MTLYKTKSLSGASQTSLCPDYWRSNPADAANLPCIPPNMKVAVLTLYSVDKTLDRTGGRRKKRPLPGVSVVVKGTTTGSITGTDGNFTCSPWTTQRTTDVSFIGYTSQDLTIGSKSAINMMLLPSSEELTRLW